MVDEIKAAVDKVCKGPVVSCADILATAARDSVAIVSVTQIKWTLTNVTKCIGVVLVYDTDTCQTQNIPLI